MRREGRSHPAGDLRLDQRRTGPEPAGPLEPTTRVILSCNPGIPVVRSELPVILMLFPNRRRHAASAPGFSDSEEDLRFAFRLLSRAELGGAGWAGPDTTEALVESVRFLAGGAGAAAR